nr:hypothetical protein [Mucilaginibacter sp. E4BP6]
MHKRNNSFWTLNELKLALNAYKRFFSRYLSN